ncbi:mitochondrial 54S ribosomal protein bL27m [Lodderomyces beijingensis]|uniref:Large ribosomal subunit protein bL27m n=1 Tax=Lodderomyces beijingensis TaxID=1775926 RepID=A0ABP0ZU76_9ASCO
MSFVKGVFDSAKRCTGLNSSYVLNSFIPVRTATKRAAGSRTNNKDSAGRRLGPKVPEGHPIKVGQIIMRQRGTKIHPGENTKIGVDHTIYAVEPGYVRFYFDPFHPRRKYVGVALKKDIRLPKEHFAPNLRRFGYVPISDADEAEAEENWKSRKEELATPRLEKQARKKAGARQHNLMKIAASIQDKFSTNWAQDTIDRAAVRLVNIYELILAGESLEAARIQETYNNLYDLRLQFRKGQLTQQQFENGKLEYQKLAATVDDHLGISVDGTLFKSMSSEEHKRLQTELREQLQQLFQTKATEPSYRPEAAALVETPGAFNAEERNELRNRYLPKVLPLHTPGSVLTDIDLKNPPENVKVQRVFDEASRTIKWIGRPKEVFA